MIVCSSSNVDPPPVSTVSVDTPPFSPICVELAVNSSTGRPSSSSTSTVCCVPTATLVAGPVVRAASISTVSLSVSSMASFSPVTASVTRAWFIPTPAGSVSVFDVIL